MIKLAAIRRESGELFTGRNHSECYRKMREKGLPKESCVQGFVTSDGVFVDRESAAQIAFLSGQIKKKLSTLFSEDLRGKDGFEWKIDDTGGGVDFEVIKESEG